MPHVQYDLGTRFNTLSHTAEQHSRCLQICVVDVPLNASSLPVFLLDELPGLFLALSRIAVPGLRFEHLCLPVQSLPTSYFHSIFNDLSLYYALYHTARAKIANCALRVDAAVEHADHVVRAG